jgi:hypothetical protein
LKREKARFSGLGKAPWEASPDPWEEVGCNTFCHYLFNFGTGDFDPLRWIQNGTPGKLSASLKANENRPCTSETNTHPGKRQVQDVRPAGKKVIIGLLQPLIVKGAKTLFDARVEQIDGPKIVLAQGGLRKIAAAFGEVGRQIAKDIHELKSLTESNSTGNKGIEILARSGGKMGETYTRPELTYTTSNAKGVIIEFGVGLQGHDVGRSSIAEAQEVHFLPLGNSLKDGLDQLAV